MRKKMKTKERWFENERESLGKKKTTKKDGVNNASIIVALNAS